MKGRPQAGEYGAHAEADIARVEGDDAVEALARQAREVAELFGSLSESAITGLRYAQRHERLMDFIGHTIGCSGDNGELQCVPGRPCACPMAEGSVTEDAQQSVLHGVEDLVSKLRKQ